MSRPSLETYIQQRYYNLLFAKAKSFLIEHREEIDLSTRNIRNPRNYSELIDIDVYTIYTSMLDNDRLEMEIVVTSFVEVSERYKGEIEVDEKTIWISMVTEVVLDNGIKSFVVQSVDLKEQNRRYSCFLKQYDTLLIAYQEKQKELHETNSTLGDQKSKSIRLDRFIQQLKEQDDLITAFNQELWQTSVERLDIKEGKTISLTFKNGVQIAL